MKIKMIKTACGDNYNRIQGKEYDVSREEAISLLTDNACILLEPMDVVKPKVETRTVEPKVEKPKVEKKQDKK